MEMGMRSLPGSLAQESQECTIQALANMKQLECVGVNFSESHP